MTMNYRIFRTDTRNIAIQRKQGSGWTTESYHGNSLKSLVLGLHDLIMSEYTPNADNVLESLKMLELAHAKGLQMITEMVKEYYEPETGAKDNPQGD